MTDRRHPPRSGRRRGPRRCRATRGTRRGRRRRARHVRGNARSEQPTSIEARQARLRDLYELGDITRDDYVQRRDVLTREADGVRSSGEPTFVRQRTALRSLVDDWAKMTGDERKRMLQLIFSEIRADHVNENLLVTFKALPHWESYAEAVLARKTATESASDPVSTSERKTGVKHAEVITIRLVLDERGWLRLAS